MARDASMTRRVDQLLRRVGSEWGPQRAELNRALVICCDMGMKLEDDNV